MSHVAGAIVRGALFAACATACGGGNAGVHASTPLTPDQIDASELTGFARRTLRIVNALQA